MSSPPVANAGEAGLLLDLAGQYHALISLDGDGTGNIVAVDDDVVIQCTGPNVYVVHQRHGLEHLMIGVDIMEIKDGRDVNHNASVFRNKP